TEVMSLHSAGSRSPEIRNNLHAPTDRRMTFAATILSGLSCVFGSAPTVRDENRAVPLRPLYTREPSLQLLHRETSTSPAGSGILGAAAHPHDSAESRDPDQRHLRPIRLTS